jgi:hypothetical protein
VLAGWLAGWHGQVSDSDDDDDDDDEQQDSEEGEEEAMRWSHAAGRARHGAIRPLIR